MRIYGLDTGNYILVAVGKSAAYGSTLQIKGSEKIKKIDNAITVSNYDVSDYRQGRGSAVVEFYTVSIEEPTTLTFSVAANTAATTSYNSVGNLTIYRFK